MDKFSLLEQELNALNKKEREGDYICISPFDNVLTHITFYKSEDGISVITNEPGLIGMNVNDFAAKVKQELPEFEAKLYLNAIQFAKTHFEIQEQLANKEN